MWAYHTQFNIDRIEAVYVKLPDLHRWTGASQVTNQWLCQWHEPVPEEAQRPWYSI